MTKISVKTIRERLELTVDTEGTVDLMDFFCNDGPYLLELVDKQENEVRQLKAWVSDLQAGCYINCVYCGHRYGPDSEVSSSMANVLKEHVEKCPQHPLSKSKELVDEAETLFREVQEIGYMNKQRECIKAWLEKIKEIK